MAHFKIIGNYCFFYGGCFSQWYPSKIQDNGITFSCAEQRMMYLKAILFNDFEIAKNILKTTNPKEQKALGRKVKNFDATKWNNICRKIVFESNFLKFTQNIQLQDILLSTNKTLLVEASPYDSIWGIKRGLDFPQIGNKSTWRGTNWLGKEITKVKIELMRKYHD